MGIAIPFFNSCKNIDLSNSYLKGDIGLIAGIKFNKKRIYSKN